MKTKKYVQVYYELEEIIGKVNAIKLCEFYRGQALNIPMRLYSQEYTEYYVKNSYGSEKVNEIARNLDITERRVRQIVAKLKKEGELSND